MNADEHQQQQFEQQEREEMETTNKIEQSMIELHGDCGPLFLALAKAQGELGPAIKSSENPHFKSSYADLAANLEAALPVLSKHNLSLIQIPTDKDGRVCVTTILAYENGAYISGTFSMAPNKPGPHGAASCVTYLRRYSLAIYGAFADDDDANEAQNVQNKGAIEVDLPAIQAKLNKAKDLKGAWDKLKPAERKAIAENAADWWQKLKESHEAKAAA